MTSASDKSRSKVGNRLLTNVAWPEAPRGSRQAKGTVVLSLFGYTVTALTPSYSGRQA